MPGAPSDGRSPPIAGLAAAPKAPSSAAAGTPLPVGILGGMGPAAGADFVRLFVEACSARMQALGLPVTDQGFPEHWLAQLPVPDRSMALAASTAADRDAPLGPMLSALDKLSGLGVRSVAIACNTAHAWHALLQSRFPHLDLLHMADETAAHLVQAGVQEAGLLATTGTYRTGLYGQALQRAGVRCHVPAADEQALLMRGIYEGVKAGNMELASRCFEDVAEAMQARHPRMAVIMGCTEIPLVLPASPKMGGMLLVDPGAVLAAALARRAFAPCATHFSALPSAAPTS